MVLVEATLSDGFGAAGCGGVSVALFSLAFAVGAPLCVLVGQPGDRVVLGPDGGFAVQWCQLLFGAGQVALGGADVPVHALDRVRGGQPVFAVVSSVVFSDEVQVVLAGGVGVSVRTLQGVLVGGVFGAVGTSKLGRCAASTAALKLVLFTSMIASCINLDRFVVPNIAGPARIVPLRSFEDSDLSYETLR